MSTDSPPVRLTRSGIALLLGAAFVVVVAGLKLAAALIVPVLLSAFIAVLMTPALRALERRRVPTGLALLLLVVVLAGLALGFGSMVAASVREFNQNLPEYQASLQEKSAALVDWLAQHGVHMPEQGLVEVISPGSMMRITGTLVSALSGLLGNTLLILLVIVFMLLEASILPEKLRGELSETNQRRLGQVLDDVRRYMGLKTLISAGTGLLVGAFLAIYGVDSAPLLGLLAFAFNFIPNIGSIIAAVPGVLLALVQFGPAGALVVAIGYVVVNVVVGNVIEPRVLGSGLGISPLVVLLSLLFWGWVFGAIGMLLAIPLTMCVVIVLDSQPETRRIAHLLGARPQPDEA
ncbi:MAG TPA: AI-2E family transporter [Thermoanaerobaculia bacterium]|nr:AI-2E family transporter [Thermoanaerobaculia bacterium]